MKSIKTVLVLSAVAMLGGCIAVPVGPGYYGGAGYYDGPRYYAPAPVYYGPPVSLGIGIGGGGRGYRGWR
jgi:hypothetical protein